MSVIITSANSLKALITTRNLGENGIRITTADHHKHPLSNFSKFSKHTFNYPDPKIDETIFIKCLIKYLGDHQHDVLMPTHSEDTYVISKYKKDLEKYIKVPVPDYDKITMANDKGSMMEIADKIGVPIPKTYTIADIGKLRSIAREITYPTVIKLRETTSSIGLSYAYSEDDLVKKYLLTIKKFLLSPDKYPIIQEYIPGDGYGVSMLFNKGELRARFTHKRIREYPISGGPSTCRIGVKNNPMERYAENILKYFKWTGLAMVEFKLDARTGTPVLIEVNPRMWGSINQAIRSGVQFPYLLYKMAMDGDIKPVLEYPPGIRTKNYFIDSVAILNYIKKYKNIYLLKELLNFYYDDVLSIEDPLPALRFILTGLKKMS